MSRVLFVLCSVTLAHPALAACAWEGSASSFFRCLMGVTETVDEHEERLNGLEDALWNLSDITDDLTVRLEAVEGAGSAGGGGVMYGDVYIDNSIDLAALAGYTEITGNLSIYGSPPTLEGLEALTSVGGNLYISSPYLTHVDHLENLTTIGGDLEIYGSNELTNLDGLTGLTEIGDDLAVMFTTALTQLNGLNAVSTVGGSVRIESNTSLEQIEGLNGLVNTDLGVYIESNHVMTSVGGLSALTSIGTDLQFKNNDTLSSLTGLSSLSSVGAHMEIMNNPALCQSAVDSVAAGVSVGTTTTTTGNLDGC